MSKLFLLLYNKFEKHPLWLWVILVLLVSSLGYTAWSIDFEEDITKMIPNNDKTRRYQEALSQSNILDKFVVTISTDSTEYRDSVTAAMDSLALWMQTDTAFAALITDVRYKIDEEQLSGIYDLIYRNLPVYLEDNDYRRIDSLMSEQAVNEVIEKDYHRLISPASIVFKKFLLKDPLSISSPVLLKLKNLQADTSVELYEGYIMKNQQRSGLMVLSLTYASNDTRHNTLLIDQMDQYVVKLKQKFPYLKTTYFGGAAVAVANARQIQKDIQITASIAILVIILALFFFYRSIFVPVLVLLPVIFGVLFSLAMVTLVQGSMSVIAMGAGAVVLGVAVDYSLHVFAHYRHTRSMEEVIKDITTPMLIGSVSTVGAFFSLLFVNSQILRDFGLFSAFSLIGAALFTLIFLPHWLSDSILKKEDGWVMKKLITAINVRPEKSRILVVLMLLLTVMFYWFSSDVRFESELSSLNYMTNDLRKAEQELYASIDNKDKKDKSVFLIYKGNSLSDVLATQEKSRRVIDSLIHGGKVMSVAGTSGIILSDPLQQQRIEKWNRYWTPEKKTNLKKWIQNAAVQYGFKPEAFDEFYSSLDHQYFRMTKEDQDFLINVFLKDFIRNAGTEYEMIASMRVPVGVDLSTVESFNTDAIFLLDRQAFYNTFIEIVTFDFNQIVVTCSLMVFLILLISYGRIELTMISFIPMMMSWIWILGIMGLFEIKFNVVNIIISTFIFGLGDDYSIFFTDGLQKEYVTGKKNLSSYKVSVFLSAFTTVIGMGVLIFAQHPALKSIAVISVIGILSVVLISYTFIPWLFNVLISNRAQKGLPPLTMGSMLRSLVVYVYFITGCILLTVLGFVFFKILRAKKTGKLSNVYHWLLMITIKSVVYMMVVIKKVIINPHKENFDRPAVVIANHQSFLDILLLLMLHPKMIMVTNSWVWNSPFFGHIVRMAGFINTVEGVEQNLTHIKEMVNKGYSIIIFPEGKRSENLNINRFHKGAFFLAQELQLDIVPVVLYGTGMGIRKQDFMLNRFNLFIKVLPRIPVSATQYGITYSERTKAISKYFKAEYEQLRGEIPAATYFHTVLSSYIYKGPVVEWYYRIKVAMEKSYEQFDKAIPAKARIYDLGCGYGFLTYFLSLKSSERVITGVDYDEEKIAIASHSYLKNDRIHFVCGQVQDIHLEAPDVILLLDVLHYLSVDAQKQIIAQCLQSLPSGGMLLIRDGDSQDDNHKRTRWTEWLSVRVFKFNKSKEKSLSFFSARELLRSLDENTVEVKVWKDSKVTSNVIYRITKK